MLRGLRWGGKFLLVVCVNFQTGCVFLYVDTTLSVRNISITELKSVPRDLALLAFESDQPIQFANFNIDENRIPTSCWAYVHFQAGPNPPTKNNNIELSIFAVPPGSYTVHAFPGFYKAEKLPFRNNFWLTFTLRRGDRLFLGIRSNMQLRQEPQENENPEIKTLRQEGFDLGEKSILHTERQSPPPGCFVGP